MLVKIKAKLLDAGKNEGCVSFTLLNELIPDDIKETSIIEELFDFLAEHNIEIVSEEKSGQRRTLSGERWADYKQSSAGTLARGKDGKTDSISSTDSADEPHDPEETTTTYLREMGRFELLTPEEEGIYRRTIPEGFDPIIRAIREDNSGVPEMETLTARIDLWEKRDPSLKPKKQQLNFMKESVARCASKYPDIREIFELHTKIEAYVRSIEAAKDEMIRANLRLDAGRVPVRLYQG
jgi:RNA polymerase primary sigma factor